MAYRNIIDGIDITAFNYKPDLDQWAKFLAYVRKAAPPELENKIYDVQVAADCTERGTLFVISYGVRKIVGKLIPEDEINALKVDDEP
ncbi:MAG: hypothetical protein IJ774_07610 [Selenomonadaceae bacterium]|nr:hypothetical protein [Selenomonadaceae bacterium]MBR1806235.1 hypothetical protein [Selenomonadaceae bacterium]